METGLVYHYASKAADGGETIISAPIRLGYKEGESNYIKAEFEELHIEGRIDAWFDQVNLMSMWLIISSRGIRRGQAPGSCSIDPGPGKSLVVNATLRCRDDFQNLYTGLIGHLTKVGEQYL